MMKETNKYAIKLNIEIERVIAAIIQGDSNDRGDVHYSVPILEVKLEDSELEDNVDLFIQIVNKHMAIERYLQYQEVQKIFKLHHSNPTLRNQMNAFSTFESSRSETTSTNNHFQLAHQEIVQISTQINFNQIYIDVFNLFDIKCMHDPSLSVTKMYAFFENKNQYEDAISYVASMREAHNQLLTDYIYQGCKFLQLISKPIKSKDMMYGQPDLYQKLLDKVIADKDNQFNEQIFQAQDEYKQQYLQEKPPLQIMTESFIQGID